MANLPLPEGLEKKDLECVMIDVESFDIERALGEDFNEDDLFYGDEDGPLKYAQGAVGAETAHMSLLFGIHPSEEYELSVLTVLDNWEIPQILIDEVIAFPKNSDDQDYWILVGKVSLRSDLVAGYKRLEVLPHTNDFPFRPHITLAYIKDTADKELWLSKLNAAFAHTFVTATNLNLGLD